MEINGPSSTSATCHLSHHFPVWTCPGKEVGMFIISLEEGRRELHLVPCVNRLFAREYQATHKGSVLSTRVFFDKSRKQILESLESINLAQCKVTLCLPFENPVFQNQLQQFSHTVGQLWRCSAGREGENTLQGPPRWFKAH